MEGPGVREGIGVGRGVLSRDTNMVGMVAHRHLPTPPNTPFCLCSATHVCVAPWWVHTTRVRQPTQITTHVAKVKPMKNETLGNQGC